MKDNKSRRRKYLANLEQKRMLAAYEHECIDFEPRMETNEEKAKRLKRREQERRHKERYCIK